MNFAEAIKTFDYIINSNGISIVPLLLGHTGIGKTQLVQQYAAQRNMDLIILHVAQLEPSDFVGLYKINEDERTANCPPNWLPYKPMVVEFDKTKTKESLATFMSKQGFINPNGGIVFLDEINRGHEDIRQALYQLLTAKKIHTYSLPEKYTIVAAANPSDLYECYEFDRALINRLAWIKFQPEPSETIKYLTGKHGKNLITSWVATDKSLIDYGTEEFEVSDLALSPRILDDVIPLYARMEEAKEKKEFMRQVLETVMPKEKVQSFLSYLDEMKFISHKDVLAGKKKDKIKELVEMKRMDVLSTITMDLGEIFSSTLDKVKVDGLDEKIDTMVKNLCGYLTEIPEELCTAFIDKIPQEMYNNPKSILQHEDFRKALKPKLKPYARLFGNKK